VIGHNKTQKFYSLDDRQGKRMIRHLLVVSLLVLASGQDFELLFQQVKMTTTTPATTTSTTTTSSQPVTPQQKDLDYEEAATHQHNMGIFNLIHNTIRKI